MFLSGISTRSLALLSKRLIGRSISHTEISLANRELQAAAETWRERDLSEERYKYLFIDGVHFKMRVKDSIENIPVLAVIGVNQDGYKTVLALQQGDKESASQLERVVQGLERARIGFRFRRIGSDGWLSRIGKSVQRRVFPSQSATMSSPCGQKRAG